MIAKGLIILAALVTAGALLMGHATPKAGAPALVGTADQWRTGPSFYMQSNCYDYGARQVWPEWRCSSENGLWVYHYRVPLS